MKYIEYGKIICIMETDMQTHGNELQTKKNIHERDGELEKT